MTNYRGTWMTAAALAAALSLAGCGSTAPGTTTKGSSLTVSKLVAEVQLATSATGKPCPIAYDVVAAGAKAGLTGAVSPADDPMDAATDTTPNGDDFLKKVAPAATLLCSFKLGDSTVHTMLVAVNHVNTAVNVALPQINFWSGGDLSALNPFLAQVAKASPGTPVTGPGNKAAVVRLDVSGGGDALLAASVESTPPLTADKLNALTAALATQVH